MTLLEYAFMSEPAVLQAGTSAQLTLAVSNPSGRAVTCRSIGVVIPSGTNAKDLVTATTGIGTMPPSSWNALLDGDVITLTPATNDAGLIGGQGLAFVFTGLAINAQPGICAVTIAELATNTSAAPAERTTSVAMNKFPAGFALTGPTAHPLGVAPGGATTIMWTGSPASYALSYDPDGQGVQRYVVGNIGPYTATGLSDAAGVDFTLTVQIAVPGADDPMVLEPQVHVDVSVPAPVITSFTGVFGGTFGTDAFVTLSWTVTGRDVTCTITGSSVLYAPNGSVAVPADGAVTSSYTLTAGNVNGTDSATITVAWGSSTTKPIALNAPVNIALSADGGTAYAACADNVYAVDLATGSVMAPPRGAIWSALTVNLLPNGTQLAMTDGDQMALFDAKTLALLPFTGIHWGVGLPSQAPYGTTAALSHDATLYYAPMTGVCIYEVGPPPRTADVRAPGGSAVPLVIVISPDGSALLVAGEQTAQFTTLATSQATGPLDLPPGMSYIGGAYHPNGTTAYLLSVAAADGTKTLTAWDVPANTATGSVTYGANTPLWCCGVAVTSDGAYVLCGGVDAVQVVRTAPLELAGTLPATGLGPTTDIRLTSDGTTAVVCSCTANAVMTTQLPRITGGRAP